MKNNNHYLYVDISITDNSKFRTGIQRVVREFSENFKKINDNKLIIKFINLNNPNGTDSDPNMSVKNFLTLSLSVKKIIDFIKITTYKLFPKKIIRNIASYTTRFYFIKNIYHSLISEESDSKHTLLLIDSNWTRDALILSKFFKNDGHRVVSVFYDLSPILEPDFFDYGVSNNFKTYWFEQLRYSDLILSISKTISDEFQFYIKENKIKTNKNIKFDSIKLGCNFIKTESLNIEVVRQKNKFLVVGSIEPRKNVSTILNAFELLWQDNSDFSLTIAYNNHWQEKSLLSILKKHPLLNKKLFLIYGSSDRELAIEYLSSNALISASIYEGYGLGLAEALNFGCKVFASNIPVYKELFQDNIIFFENNARALKEAIINEANSNTSKKTFKPISWQKATNDLIRKISVQ